ncbi:hypothetical protein LSPH24S_08187 [Lysinibacillus sphaericus]
MNNILEATRINKIVELGKNNELHILKDVNLEIKEGQFVAGNTHQAVENQHFYIM